MSHARSLLSAVACAAAVAGCVRARPTITVDPTVTFAAHRERTGLVVDRLGSGRTGRVQALGWSLRAAAPSFVLASDGETLAAFWIPGPAQVVVRRTPEPEAAPLGAIDPTWEAEVIRLTIAPAEGMALRSDVLAREGGGTGPSALSRAAQTTLDVRGTYRAALRDPKGTAIGWLRVRVGPYQVAPRLYDGVLPAAVDPILGITAALALDAEIDWIEDHAIDVYPGGNLEQSVPMGR